MRLLVLAACAALAACFSPDVLDGSFVCGGPTVCPPGYGCGCDNKCWADPTRHTCGGGDIDARTAADAPIRVDAPVSLPDAPLGMADAPAARPDAPPPPPDATVPDASTPDALQFCGDGICQDRLGENCSTCHGDCGDCISCSVLNCLLGGITCRNCPDCGACDCDGICQPKDTRSCPSDCGL